MVSMIALVKISDSCQYFVGSRFGRRKLAPLLSPGKTWEGAVGGILLGIVLGPLVFTALLYGSSGLKPTLFVPWMIYALLVSTVGIVGDLAESLLKREAGVKDSSTWLPGLGGILDVLDSLLLAAPVAYACWVSGLLGP